MWHFLDKLVNPNSKYGFVIHITLRVIAFVCFTWFFYDSLHRMTDPMMKLQTVTIMIAIWVCSMESKCKCK